jgi:hypothetical protein
MTDEEPIIPVVTSDLRTLAALELPPKTDPAGRHIVKVTILFFSIFAVASLAALTYALFASLDRENSLKNEIGCVRQSAVNVDAEVADGIGVLIDNANTILVSLDAVAANDDAALLNHLAGVEDLVTAGETAKSELDFAIVKRQEAVNTC